MAIWGWRSGYDHVVALRGHFPASAVSDLFRKESLPSSATDHRDLESEVDRGKEPLLELPEALDYNHLPTTNEWALRLAD